MSIFFWRPINPDESNAELFAQQAQIYPKDKEMNFSP
jgi:hypothetical protein